MANNRLDYISIAKGIGIILVVIGHCVGGRVGNFIYLFHMPLFFMLTGYLFKESSVSNLASFIKRKTMSLYIPFVGWNLFFLFCHNLFFKIGFYKEGVLNLHVIEGFWPFLKDVLGVFTLIHMEQVAAPTWFLRVLFISTLVYAFINRIFSYNKKARTAIAGCVYVASFAIFYIYNGQNSIIIYMVLCFMALFFMEVGRVYKQYENNTIYTNIRILGAFITLVILNEFGHVNIVSLEFENPLFLFLVSVIGLYMVLGISKMIDKSTLFYKNLLVYVGNHTLIILVLHCFIFKLLNIVYMYVTRDETSIYQISNATSLLWALLYISMGVAIPLIFEFFYLGAKSRIKDIIMR